MDKIPTRQEEEQLSGSNDRAHRPSSRQAKGKDKKLATAGGGGSGYVVQETLVGKKHNTQRRTVQQDHLERLDETNINTDEDDNDSEDSGTRPGVVRVRGWNRTISDGGTSSDDDNLGDDTFAPTDRNRISIDNRQGNDVDVVTDSSQMQQQEQDLLPEAQVFGEDDMEEEFNRRIKDRAVMAQVVANDPNSKTFRQRYPYALYVGCLFVVILVVGVIILVVLLGGRDPPLAEEPTLAHLQELAIPISGKDKVYNSSSAQYAALEWIINSHHNYDFDDIDDADSTKDGTPSRPIFNLLNTTDELILERYALAVLYFETGGDSWYINYGFLSNTTACAWTLIRGGLIYGTQCDQSGRVSTLWLDGNNMVGTIPSELVALESLTLISLANNELSGTIPSAIGTFPRLSFLRLDTNYLTGTIPESIQDLINLERIYIFENQLSGTIPPGITMNSNLVTFLAYKNQLSGTVPEFATRARIETIQLEFNFLTGAIPISLFFLNRLEIAIMSNNLLTGSISAGFGQLTGLEVFEFQNNDLTGPIPSEIGSLRRLRMLNLRQNRFSGSIPSELGSVETLTHVDMSTNRLTGTLPSELAGLKNLKEFSAGSNSLTGSVPASLGSLKNIERFSIGRNNITEGLDAAFCTGPISTTLYPEVQADCGGISPIASCSCCTSCCDPDSGNCTTNREAVCNLSAARIQVEGGKYYSPERGTTCECVDDNRRVSCWDTGCETCNIKRSVCGRSYDYGMVFDDNGKFIGWRHNFEYTKGRSGNVSFSETFPYVCEAYVGGEKCNTCIYHECFDLFRGVAADCSNVDMPGESEHANFYTHCGSYESGPMEALSMVFLYSGCPLPYYGFEANGILQI